MYSKALLIGLAVIFIGVAGYFGYLKLSKNPVLKQPISSSTTKQPQELAFKDLVEMLQASASASQSEQIFKVVEKLSKEGSSLTLNDCKPDIQVLKTNSGEISVKNAGTKKIKISGISSLKDDISAGQVVTLKIDPALYIYSCEPSSADRLEHMGLIYKVASNSAQKSTAQNYRDQAVNTTAIEFNKCEPSPKVIKINKTDSVTIKNNNSFDINFYFSADNGKSTKISPNQTVILTPVLQGDLTWFGCFAKDITATTGVIVAALGMIIP